MIMRDAKAGDRITFMYNNRFRRVTVELVRPHYIKGYDQGAQGYRTFNMQKLAAENPLRFLGVLV